MRKIVGSHNIVKLSHVCFSSGHLGSLLVNGVEQLLIHSVSQINDLTN